MQQYLTLEEAAKYLQMPADELREMAKKKAIRAFQDRGSWRFRAQDIEELARTRGLGSDAELQLREAKKTSAESKKTSTKKPEDQDLLTADFALEDEEVPLGKEKQGAAGPKTVSGKSGPRTPKPGSDSDVRLVMEGGTDFLIEEDSEVRLDRSGPKSPGKKKPKTGSDSGVRLVPPADQASDSDVRLEPSGKDSGIGKKSKSPSDSDIRLHDAGSGKKKGPESGIITEEIDLDAEQAKLAQQQAKKEGKGGKPTQMAKKSALPTESPFELSEPDLDLDKQSKGSKKSDVDSSSDFELIPFDSSKSPVELGSGEIPLLAEDEEVHLGNEVRGKSAGSSGINLQDPADSGISLEDGGSDEIEFELSLDPEGTPKPKARSATRKPAPDDSSSEFELSLDDGSSLSPSSSEFELSVEEPEVSVDSSSEFELSLEDSGDSVELGKDDSSDSEFELTLDDEGGLAVEEDAGDIFEETNFDVPALEDESGSEAVALDEGDTDLEGSDFEISLDEDSSTDDSDSGSEVVALEDEEEADDAAATVAKPRKTTSKSKAKAKAVADDESGGELDLDLDDEPTSKKKKKTTAVEEEDEDVEEEDELAPAAAAPDWGAYPVFMLFPTVIVLFLVGIMGFEVLRSMWGYQRPTAVGKPVIDFIARQIDDSLPK